MSWLSYTHESMLDELPSSSYVNHHAIWLDECTNTQDLLSHAPKSIDTIATLSQTQGRGRRGNIWTAPAQAVLCMSHRIHTIPWDTMRYIPLILAVCLWETVRYHSLTQDAVKDPQSLRIKWPNDLLFKHRKLAGILCETRSMASTQVENHTPSHLPSMILGVGINLYSHPDLPTHAMSLYEDQECRQQVDKKVVTTWQEWIDQFWMSCCHEIERLTVSIQRDYFRKSLLNRWREYALPTGTIMKQANVEGRYIDIDDMGALCLETVHGIHKIDSGEVDVITWYDN